MKQETYWVLEYDELDKLIKKHFGHQYSCVTSEEWSNDSAWTWMFKIEPLNEWEQKDLDEFQASGRIRNWQTYVLMQDMVNTGALPEGNYLVEACW